MVDVEVAGVVQVPEVMGAPTVRRWVERDAPPAPPGGTTRGSSSSNGSGGDPYTSHTARMGVLADSRLQVGRNSGFRRSMRLWFEFGLACLAAGRQVRVGVGGCGVRGVGHAGVGGVWGVCVCACVCVCVCWCWAWCCCWRFALLRCALLCCVGCWPHCVDTLA